VSRICLAWELADSVSGPGKVDILSRNFLKMPLNHPVIVKTEYSRSDT